MQIEFSVGKIEVHQVQFTWGQLFGTSSVRVDGRVVLRGRPVALEEATILANQRPYLQDIARNREIPWQRIRSWDLELGGTEKHHVRIEKERPRWLAAFRRHRFRVIVDGELILERCGY